MNYKYESEIKSRLNDKFSERGEELTCKCPFGTHPDKNPSFHINMETGLYNCFGCGEKGNICTFIAKMDGTDTASVYQKLNGYGDSPLERYSAEKQLPLDLLKDLGVDNCYKDVHSGEHPDLRSQFGGSGSDYGGDKRKFLWTRDASRCKIC